MIKKRKFNKSNNPIVFRPMTVYNNRGVNIQEEVERQMSQQLPPLKSDVFVDEFAVNTNPPVPEVSSEGGIISSILDSIDVSVINDPPVAVPTVPHNPDELKEDTNVRDKSDKKLLYGAIGFGIAVFLFLINND